MAGSITIPSNTDDPIILRRFLVDLVNSLNGSNLLNNTAISSILPNALSNNGTSSIDANFLRALANNKEIQNTIKQLVKGSIQEQILQSVQNIAKVSQQFGTFYDQAQAAAWYGLTIKAGGVISGYTIGALDRDTTTPGTEGSFMAFNADYISFAKAIEDITDPAELAYLEANNLPYGTMYDADTGSIIPAFLMEWTGLGYNIFFNGIVSFNNVTNSSGTSLTSDLADKLSRIQTLEETNDGVINSFYAATAPSSGMSYGDWWVDIDSSPLKAYRYEDIDGKNVNTLDWRDNSNSIIGKAYIQATSAQATADGKITTFYGPLSSMLPELGSDGDIYVVNTTKTQYIKSSGSWVYIDPATAINGNTTTINGGKITTGSITAIQIGTNTIISSSANIADGVIINAKIANGTITTAKIADATITNTKIANAAISNAHIQDLSVTEGKIADAAITNAKIGNIIESIDYNPGISGWCINKNGNAEFNGVVISRPQVVASGSAVYNNDLYVLTNSTDPNYDKELTIWIDTGYNLSSAGWGSENFSLTADAWVRSTYINTSVPYNTPLFQIFSSAIVHRNAIHYRTGSTQGYYEDKSIYLEVRILVKHIALIAYLPYSITGLDWVLKKVY